MLGTFFFLIALAGSCCVGFPDEESEPMADGRIIGGRSVLITDHPHQIALIFTGFVIPITICGGSIISERYVITAAHCTAEKYITAESLEVRCGSNNHDAEGEVVKVAKIHQHPQYNTTTFNDYDISILELAIDLKFSDSIKAVRLPDLNKPIIVGSEATVTGWGVQFENGTKPEFLQEVTVEIMSHEECQDIYGHDRITERMLCAGVHGGGKDACQGDSGGPLLNDHVLTGVVSWGKGCARPDYPGVYASVPNLRDYVQEVTGI